jgi:hypothetical protein
MQPTRRATWTQMTNTTIKMRSTPMEPQQRELEGTRQDRQRTQGLTCFTPSRLSQL